MMDPVSFLLGFSRALVPPMAAPAPQREIPMPATTNLGLDHDKLREIYADRRVQATPKKQEVPPQPGVKPAGDANAQAQQVQQIQEAPRIQAASGIDAADRVALLDPLLVATMKEIYADRLTLSAPACRDVDTWLVAADAPLPWSSQAR